MLEGMRLVWFARVTAIIALAFCAFLFVTGSLLGLVPLIPAILTLISSQKLSARLKAKSI